MVTPQTDILDRELEQNRVVTGDLIIVEFLQGFRDNKHFQIARHLMEALEYHDFVGKEIAVEAAGNFRKLRKQGIAIRNTIAVLIATFCSTHDLELLHNDRDYDPMEELLGLRVKR